MTEVVYPPSGDRKSESSVPLTSSAESFSGRNTPSSNVQQQKPLSEQNEPAYSCKHWSNGKKVLTTLLLCIATLASTYSSSAYTSSIPTLEEDFNMSERMAYAGVAFYVLGYALGPLTWAPFSTVWGKRPIYIVSYVLFCGFMWGCSQAPNTGSLMVFRFIAGFCSCSTLNNAASSIGDYTWTEERGLHAVVYAIFAFGGPCLGPLFGGIIVTELDSQWNFDIMAIFSSVGLVLVTLIPETYLPVLAKKHGEASVQQAASAAQPSNPIMTALWQPFYMLATEPILLCVSLYLALLYALIYAFFAILPVIYLDHRNWSVTSLSKSYIALGCGFLFGGLFIILLSGLAAKKRARLGIQPDLYDIFKIPYITSWMIPCALFIFAFCSGGDQHPIGDLIAEVLFGWGVICAFMSFITFLLNMYEHRSASAVGAGTFLRSLLAAAFPLFITDCVDKLGVEGTCALFGGLGVLAIPLPLVIQKIGMRHRAARQESQLKA